MENLQPYGRGYLVHNLVNGKVYVGQTIYSVSHRWSGHVSATKIKDRGTSSLHSSIRKHGRDNFLVEEIGQAKTKSELDNLESLWIILLGTVNRKAGYNLRSGGSFGRMSEEAKEKLRKPKSDSARKAMSVARTGKKLSPEHRANIAKAGRGRKHTEEWKVRMREINIGHHRNLGIPKSEETKKRMRKPKSPEHAEKCRANIQRARSVQKETGRLSPRDGTTGRFLPLVEVE